MNLNPGTPREAGAAVAWAAGRGAAYLDGAIMMPPPMAGQPVARPFGGLLFGHYGDRIGRKKVLVIRLCLTAVASTLMGVIPGYESIGVAAFALLVFLRILQGLGAGAEYAGGALMAAEHAPPGKRGLYTAVPPTGTAVTRESAAAIAGGTLPFVAAALTAATGGTWALSTLMIFMCVLSPTGVSGLRDGRELSFVEQDPRLDKETAPAT